MLGNNSLDPFTKKDHAFYKRTLRAKEYGITRHELSVYRDSGYLSMLDGRPFSIDEAKMFVRTTKRMFDLIFRSARQENVIQGTVWKVSTDRLMERFGHLSRNIVVIGDKRLTICYCKHELSTYTTG